MMTTNWDKLREDHEIASLRIDIRLGSPESYSLDEKRQICADMEASTAEVDAALKSDFGAMPLQTQSSMLDMLCNTDPALADW